MTIERMMNLDSVLEILNLDVINLDDEPRKHSSRKPKANESSY